MDRTLPIDEVTGGRIVVIDDEEANVALLGELLGREGFTNVASTTEPAEGLALCARSSPDLVLLDLHMPGLDGFEVLERLASLYPGRWLPVIVLTGDSSPAVKHRALASGARDFLTKPFDPVEVALRCRNMIEASLMRRRLELSHSSLQHTVRERSEELSQARLEVVQRLALAAEYRDDETGEHAQRVGAMAARLAERLGVRDEEAALLRHAAALHDVGKIGIPDRVLLKHGSLTEDEFETVRMHTTIGARILGGSASPLLRMATEIAISHHEHWDGRGYPRGLAADEIPLVGRLVAVADVFDALSHDRPYRPAWPIYQAVAEIEKRSAAQFDPQVVEAFRRMV